MALYAKISCSLPADEAIMAAGDLAELVYIRSILFCREHLTDGIVFTNQLRRVCIGIRGNPVTHAQRLVDAGLWEEIDGGWRIPIDLWREWNPLKAEVDAKRAEEAQRKKDYRDKLKASADVPTGQKRTHGTRDRQPEPEPEPERRTTSRQRHESTSRDVGPISISQAIGKAVPKP